MRRSATAINTQHKVSRYGTSGRMEVWVSARTLCSTPGLRPALPVQACFSREGYLRDHAHAQLARGQEVDSDRNEVYLKMAGPSAAAI